MDGIREIEARARPAWVLFDASTNFQNEIYPGVGHVYLPAMWSQTLAWFERHLK